LPLTWPGLSDVQLAYVTVSAIAVIDKALAARLANITVYLFILLLRLLYRLLNFSLIARFISTAVFQQDAEIQQPQILATSLYMQVACQHIVVSNFRRFL